MDAVKPAVRERLASSVHTPKPLAYTVGTSINSKTEHQGLARLCVSSNSWLETGAPGGVGVLYKLG